MKKFKIFIALILILLPLQGVFAQTAFASKTEDLTFFSAVFPSTNINSTATVYSEWFTLRGYDSESMSTYPLLATYNLSSTAGKPRILWVIEGSNNLADANELYTVDTLSANADSLETYQSSSMSFNGKKFLNYRFKITGTAGNQSDTYAKAELYYPRKKLQ